MSAYVYLGQGLQYSIHLINYSYHYVPEFTIVEVA